MSLSFKHCCCLFNTMAHPSLQASPRTAMRPSAPVPVPPRMPLVTRWMRPATTLVNPRPYILSLSLLTIFLQTKADVNKEAAKH